MSNKLNTKAVLKFLKLNESTISMILGALVIVILGIIVINFFRNTSTPQIDTGSSNENTSEEQPILQRGLGPVEYTVTKGESLWSIAEKQYGSGYNWLDIAQANKLTQPNNINTGLTLTIPDIAPKLTTVNGEIDDYGAQSVSGSNYTVSKGDSLWNIATRLYGDPNMWTSIAQANHLNNPNIIHTGNSLTIPRL